MKKLIKILSIDGGGIRGLIPAMVLADIEERTGQPISKLFDLIAGTSTGGILGLGLSMNDGCGNPEFSAKELISLYKDKGKEIFPQGTWSSAVQHLWRGFGISEEVYSHRGLEKLLKEKFGEATLENTLTRVLIPAYDIVDGEPLFLKSWEDEHKAVKIRDVARATGAAPTYFEPHQIKILHRMADYKKRYKDKYAREEYEKTIAEVEIGGETLIQKTHTLVDGGVFINSPAVSAYAEAKRIFGAAQDILVVSLGTGQINPKVTYESAKGWGMASWVRPLIKFMFDGVSDAADYQLKHLLDDQASKRYYRMQTDIDEKSGAMDLADEENIGRLIDNATSLIREKDSELAEVCALLTESGRSLVR